jgi:hypothetical protein
MPRFLTNPSVLAPPVLASHGSLLEPQVSGSNALVTVLVVIGLVASWTSAVIPAENSVTDVDAFGRLVTTMLKTPLYYVTFSLAIASVVAAGLLAALNGGLRTLGTGVRLAFYALLASAALWAAYAYTTEEMFSAEIFSSTGPFVWFTLLFVIAGANPFIWNSIDRVIRLLAYVSSGLGLHTLISSEWRYYAGFSKYTLYARLLIWLGGWTLLTATRLRGLRLFTRSIPLIMAALMAICSQSRSWTLLSGLVISAFVLLKARERGSILSGMRTLVMVSVGGAAAAAAVYVMLPGTLNNSVNGLSSRLYEDSRTGQYSEFFRVVPVGDLLLGRGPKGTWYWRGFGEYQYFDNGYLWMLFIGGVPTLVFYFAIIVWPAIRALRAKPRGDDAAAVSLVLLWGLALTGLSTYCLPSLTIGNFLISLWAGRCHILIAQNNQWRAARIQGAWMLHGAGAGQLSDQWYPSAVVALHPAPRTGYPESHLARLGTGTERTAGSIHP